MKNLIDFMTDEHPAWMYIFILPVYFVVSVLFLGFLFIAGIISKGFELLGLVKP